MTSSPSSLPLRTQVRDAVDRAWRRAIANGSLPATPDGVALPAVEVERPASADHGDFAASVALKLARPYRRSPLDIATAIAAEIAAETEPMLRRARRSRRSRWPHPDS